VIFGSAAGLRRACAGYRRPAAQSRQGTNAACGGVLYPPRAGRALTVMVYLGVPVYCGWSPVRADDPLCRALAGQFRASLEAAPGAAAHWSAGAGRTYATGLGIPEKGLHRPWQPIDQALSCRDGGTRFVFMVGEQECSHLSMACYDW